MYVAMEKCKAPIFDILVYWASRTLLSSLSICHLVITFHAAFSSSLSSTSIRIQKILLPPSAMYVAMEICKAPIFDILVYEASRTLLSSLSICRLVIAFHAAFSSSLTTTSIRIHRQILKCIVCEIVCESYVNRMWK